MAEAANSSRAARMSKNQKECFVSFLEEHKILLAQKVNPRDLQKVKEMWRELAEKLNSLQGAKKNVQQWKDALNEFKTNTRRKARLLHEEVTGTGGGPKKKKELSPIEERLLGLLSKIVIIGADIPEAGIVIEPENEVSEMPATSRLENQSILENDNLLDVNLTTMNSEGVPVISTCSTNNVKRKKRRREVEDIAKTHEQCLHSLEMSNINLASACKDLTIALHSMTKQKKKPTSAVLNLRF